MKRNTFKASVCLLLSLILAICPIIGCGKNQGTRFSVTVEGAVFGGTSDSVIQTELFFDPSWITKNPVDRYNADLAAFSALVCADSYFREKDIAKGTQNRVIPEGVSGDDYGFTTLLDKVGFKDIRHVESFKVKEYETDTNDSVTLTLAYCSVGKKYDAYIVAVRGCFSSQEWVSTFDPGCDGAAYTALTGGHTEWTDKQICKGYAIASARALEIIAEYMKEHDDPKRKDCVLVTGHSRGGAIAGIIGADLEKSAKTYTYTFNAPAVIDEDSITDVKGVFNLFDENDFYRDPLPFGDEPFARFGKDLSVSIPQTPDVLTELKYLKGRSDYSGVDEDTRNAYKELFASRFSDRASLYVTRDYTETFGSREEAETRSAAIAALVDPSGLDLGMFITVGDIRENPNGTFTLNLTSCDAALLFGYAKLLAYGQPALDAFTSLFAADQQACDIARLLMEHQNELTGGHLLVNSYVLTQYVK